MFYFDENFGNSYNSARLISDEQAKFSIDNSLLHNGMLISRLDKPLA